MMACCSKFVHRYCAILSICETWPWLCSCAFLLPNICDESAFSVLWRSLARFWSLSKTVLTWMGHETSRHVKASYGQTMISSHWTCLSCCWTLSLVSYLFNAFALTSFFKHSLLSCSLNVVYWTILLSPSLSNISFPCNPFLQLQPSDSQSPGKIRGPRCPRYRAV